MKALSMSYKKGNLQVFRNCLQKSTNRVLKIAIFVPMNCIAGLGKETLKIFHFLSMAMSREDKRGAN